MAQPSAGRDLDDATRQKIYTAFKKFDKDGNGYVTLDEAQELLYAQLGQGRETTQKMVRMCDKNKDGKLSYEEFIDFYFRIKDRKSDLKAAFEEFDANHDGHVSIEEAKNAMHNLGIFNDAEIESLLITYDENKDGKLQYDEFVRFWNAK